MTKLATAALLLVLMPVRMSAHSGPPYPLMKGQPAGVYRLSVWTDPDATDDGAPGGQFWIVVEMADGGPPLPQTRARVTVKPIDWAGVERSVVAAPVERDPATLFGAVVMEREGRYQVRIDIAGGAGEGSVNADVQATYDTRPPPGALVLYLIPFVLAGGLWLKLLLTRRRVAGQAAKP